VLTKTLMMEHFDEFVTDRALRLKDLDAHLADLKLAERLHGRYFVNATSGSTGRWGIFAYSVEEWATLLPSYSRSYAWAGAVPSPIRRIKMAVVSTTTPWHQSAMVGATARSWFTPTLRLDATDPVPRTVERLNAWQPETLVTYASMGRLLAEEQLAGRLRIAPRAVFSASEVLTEETRRRIRKAWGREPFNVYGATETATIASECEHHVGMHLFEDLVITEVVDDQNRPAAPGVYGAKVLVTVLFSRTQPLIRYEMSDSVRLTNRRCPSGWPFAMLDGIQGRSEEFLRFPAIAGGRVAVHPNVVHDVMDLVPAGGWQVVQEPDRLDVLLSGAPETAADELRQKLQPALEAQGIAVPPIRIMRVDVIPRATLGKAPLIKSNVTR
jgi:phenylacetate-CoA ligase